MLKKCRFGNDYFYPGAKVYLVTRKGEILDGFHVAQVLFDLVTLDKSPIQRSDKQGFTINRDRLVPNWCEGRKMFRAGCTSLEKAEKLLKNKVRD